MAEPVKEQPGILKRGSLMGTHHWVPWGKAGLSFINRDNNINYFTELR